MKKLPAFYVLDSVVKNVGTPYTLFFGRNLYSTFMEAYVLVDNNIRRKMEEMLKTWKEPVPGSMDTRPVFPIEITRPIENALIKARTSALQANQEYARNQQQILNCGRPGMAAVPYRDTPTPPNVLRQPQYPTGYPPNYTQYPTAQSIQPHTAPQAYNQQQYVVPQVSLYVPGLM
jgi:pre-mRNA cleavage complex 2 protein Pcf11